MFSTLSRVRQRATSLLAASAISVAAIGAGTAPATASDDQLLKFLLGATAVAIVVHAASRGSNNRAQAAPSRGLPQHCRETLGIRGRHVAVYNAQCLHRAGLRNLPQQCHETIRTNHGMRSVYRARCLEGQTPRRGPPSHAQGRGLPDWCTTSYQYQGRWHQGYSAACLQQAGLRQLPSTCLVSGSGGQVYAAQCLRSEWRGRR